MDNPADGKTAQSTGQAPEIGSADPTQLLFARNESNFDITKVKPHQCMTDIVQRGNYIHCNTGNHGMRIPADKILVQKADGSFDLEDMVVHTTNKKGKIVAAKA